MPTIQVSTRELLSAVAQLSPAELAAFAAEVMALRHQRLSPECDIAEPELLRLARLQLPEDVEQRYALLRARRRAETLTPEENAELLQLTTRTEHLNVVRLEALAALARLRKVTFPEIMNQLGIKAPPYE